MSDPPEQTVVENKPEEAIVERSGAESSDETQSLQEVEVGQAGSSGTMPAQIQLEATPSTPGNTSDAEPTNDHAFEDDSANEAAIAAAIAEDVQQMETESTDVTSTTDSVVNQNESEVIPTEPEVLLPVEHVYYFIQLFDVEAQALRTVGSFFSRREENIKTAVRKHLQWPPMKDFQVWQRVDGTTVTTLSSAETFQIFVPDGTCFIIGDKLNKDR
jgi:hypothetical protein